MHTYSIVLWDFSDNLIYCMSCFSFFLFLATVNTKNADINIWAFEPWKLIIYERINKVPVVLKTAWKSNKTELILLEFLLTSWHNRSFFTRVIKAMEPLEKNVNGAGQKQQISFWLNVFADKGCWLFYSAGTTAKLFFADIFGQRTDRHKSEVI